MCLGGTGSIESESLLDLPHLDGCGLVTDDGSLGVGHDTCTDDTGTVVDSGPYGFDLEDVLDQCDLLISGVGMADASFVGCFACGSDGVASRD